MLIMGIFLWEKNKLRCPKCGGLYDKNDGYTICIHDGCELISESEYYKSGCHEPVIKCPYCHSTDTKKITTASKVVHTAVFGALTTGRNLKEWHCNRCNSDF